MGCESGVRGDNPVVTTSPVPSRSGSAPRRMRAGVLALCAALVLAGCGSAGGAEERLVSGPAGPASPGDAAGRVSNGDATAPRTLVPRSPVPAQPPQVLCTNADKLVTWSNRRLALLTITVPVEERSTAAVTSEVAAGVGGVLLFGSSAPPTLGADLAALKKHVPGGLGLLVMTDQEGGGIQRMANLVGPLPWPAYMGSHWSAARIQQSVAAVAARMAAAQVNMDLAPVVDVDGRDMPPGSGNPDGWRSFGGSPAVVGRDGIAYMDGLRAAGVIPVLKHFPGLGGSSANSDDGPARTLPWSTLKNVGVPPFAAAIAAGAPAVMVSNNTVPGLTTVPSSLSPTVINTELRGALGFQGLVITDSLSAGAISAAGYSVPSATVQALRAGADMVMFGLAPNVPAQTEAIADAVVAAVAGGTLARSRLLDAAGAVLAVRHVSLCLR